MDNEKVFIIGDIHGCMDMLKRLIHKIDWRPDIDPLIFLGDYIDRGTDSKGVVDYILELRQRSPHVRCLQGNHETLFMDYLDGGSTRNFLFNGGTETLDSYRENGEVVIPPAHMTFFKSLESFIELDDYYVVHAGFQPGKDVAEQVPADYLWIRREFVYSEYDFGKKVIFGHTPFSTPFITENKIGLDTGAVFGNSLTCLELPVMTFHSVEA